MEIDDGNRINLTFTNFEVEFDPFGDCGFDYVEVSYGNFSEKYCGLSAPGPFISNTTITVKFHSDDFYNETGFSAMWDVVVHEGKFYLFKQTHKCNILSDEFNFHFNSKWKHCEIF